MPKLTVQDVKRMTPDQLKTVLGNMSSTEKKNLSSDQFVAKAIYDRQQIVKRATGPTVTLKNEDEFGTAQQNIKGLLDQGIDPNAVQTLLTLKMPADKLPIAHKAFNAVMQVQRQQSGVNQLVNSFKKPINPIDQRSPVSQVVGAAGDELAKLGKYFMQPYSASEGLKTMSNEALRGGTQMGTGLTKLKNAFLPSKEQPQDFSSRFSSGVGGAFDVIGGALQTGFSPFAGAIQSVPVVRQGAQAAGDILNTATDATKVGIKKGFELITGQPMSPDEEYATNKGIDIIPQLFMAKGAVKGLPSFGDFTSAMKSVVKDSPIRDMLSAKLGRHLQDNAEQMAISKSGISPTKLANSDRSFKNAGYDGVADYMLQNNIPMDTPQNMATHINTLFNDATKTTKPSVLSTIKATFETTKYHPLIDTLSETLAKTKSPEMQAIKSRLASLRNKPNLTAADIEYLRSLGDQYLDLQYTGTEKAIVKDKQNMVDAARRDLENNDPTGILKQKNAEIQGLYDLKSGAKTTPFKSGSGVWGKGFMNIVKVLKPSGWLAAKGLDFVGEKTLTPGNIYKLSKNLQGQDISPVPVRQSQALRITKLQKSGPELYEIPRLPSPPDQAALPAPAQPLPPPGYRLTKSDIEPTGENIPRSNVSNYPEPKVHEPKYPTTPKTYPKGTIDLRNIINKKSNLPSPRASTKSRQ